MIDEERVSKVFSGELSGRRVGKSFAAMCELCCNLADPESPKVFICPVPSHVEARRLIRELLRCLFPQFDLRSLGGQELSIHVGACSMIKEVRFITRSDQGFSWGEFGTVDFRDHGQHANDYARRWEEWDYRQSRSASTKYPILKSGHAWESMLEVAE